MSKQASEARERLEQFFDAGTFVEVDRLMRDGENDVPVVCGYGLAALCAVIYFLFLRKSDTGCNADELALKK